MVFFNVMVWVPLQTCMIIPPIGSDAATSDDFIGQFLIENISENMVALRTHTGIGIQPEANGSYTCTARNGIAISTSASTSVNITVAVQGLSLACCHKTRALLAHLLYILCPM